MKKILALLSILMLSVFSGCVQAEQPAAETVPDYIESIEEIDAEDNGLGDSEDQMIVEPGVPVEEMVAEAPVLEEWCEPTDLNIFVDEHLPIDQVKLFFEKDYNMEFGPIAAEKLFIGDKIFGYLQMPLPEYMNYYNYSVQGRFVNGNTVQEGETYTENDLLKYGDYYYKYWGAFEVAENENVSFEIRLTYETVEREQTQCEQYNSGVFGDAGTNVSGLVDLETVEYSRSRVFLLSGNFTEGLYNDINRDFKATFTTEHLTNSDYAVEVGLDHVNKVVCVAGSCSFLSEVNIPRDNLGNYTIHEQWCGDDFTRKLRFDRGESQPFYSDFSLGLMTNMCNKLRVGLG